MRWVMLLLIIVVALTVTAEAWNWGWLEKLCPCGGRLHFWDW